MTAWILMILTLLTAGPAQPGQPSEESLEAMFRGASRFAGVQEEAALAVARVESGFKPWAVNVAGASFIFDSKEEALAKAEAARAAGKSFDVGLMQVNSQWLERYGLPLEAVLDPLANIHLGLWILKRELERSGGDLKAALGAYHSPTPELAGPYADLVLRIMERGPLFPSSKNSGRSAAAGRSAARSVKPKPPESFGEPNAPMMVLSRKTFTAGGGLRAGESRESMKINKAKPEKGD